MKKNKLFLSLFAFIVAFAAIFGAIYSKPINVFAEEEASYKSITSLDAINDLSGQYILSADITLTNFAGINGTFTGTLDGNGHKISGTSAAPIFEAIGAGAKISNLLVDGITLSISSYQESLTLVNIGILAGTISNACIEQVSIKGSNIVMAEEESIPTNQSAEETVAIEENVTQTIKTNANVGFLAGKIVDGAMIKNSVIETSTIDVKIGDTSSENFNFGGMAGYIENTTLSNNIVNVHSVGVATNPSIIVALASDKTINFGAIAGFTDSNKLFLYNNVVILNDSDVSIDAKCTIKNIGALVGVLNYEVYASYIQGVVTTYSNGLFGKRAANTQDYKLITVTTYSTLNSSFFDNKTLWYDAGYDWDFGRIWKFEANSKLPILQCFVNYSVSFDAEESLKSLNLEVMPTVEGGDYNNVIIGKISPDQVIDVNDTTSISAVEYGTTVYIKVQITDTNKYNEFFKIEGLQLNSKTIYTNSTGDTAIGFDIECTEEDSVYTYQIKNFNANCEGIYNVLLGRDTFKIKVKVFDLGTQNTGSIIAGKFKTNSETNPMQEKIIDMQYGEKFILSTSVTNSDYSDRADWYIFDTSEKDPFGSPINFTPLDSTSKFYENYNFYYTNKIEWTFNESSEIFRPEDADYTNTKTYFDMANYVEDIDENGDLTSNYVIYIVYNTRVKQIKIVLRNDKGEQINEKVANVLIDNKSDLLTWNEEECVYYAKVAFTKDAETSYRIQIDGLNTDYEFSGWWFDIGQLTGVEGNATAGMFTITEETNDLVIYLELIENTQTIGNNMLWLYIGLGVLGVGLVILVIIIIIKKRKGGGGSSYKKYYY